ncbi:MAG TPA: alpha/beta hydrolase [Mycobacteriales bacterium]|nr:alpha/beta hydrolase [Mycobacteriales bacterium]
MALTALLGGSVLAEKTGKAPKVLALHGWARTRADWQPVMKGIGSLAVDLPGFGASPEPSEPWGSRDYAGQLAPLLEDGGWTVVGHSFGGRVAVQLAAGWPERVDRLVLTGVPLLRRSTGGKAPIAYRAARRAHRMGLLSDARMEAERRKHGSADYRAAQGVLRDTLVRLVNEDYRELLPQVKAGVAMVWGAHDTAAPLAMAREAVDLFPTATLTVSETSGHLLDAELVALLRKAIRGTA